MNLRRQLDLTVGLIVLAATTVPGAALPQDARQGFDARERLLVERIADEESANGPYSERLIGPLTNLSLLYEEAADFESADASIERLIGVMRAEHALDSLAPAPSIRQLIQREDARGNAEAAWDLEQELLGLAARHRNDIAIIAILRDTADRRLEILRRYIAGEFPAEIVLGCYYDASYFYLGAWTRGSQPLSVAPASDTHYSCATGNRAQAKRALFGEAQSLYVEATRVMYRNELYTSEELEGLLTILVETSYRYGNPALGRSSLRYLFAYESMSSDEWLPRIEALVHLADWDLLYSNSGNDTKAALAAYQQAYELARIHGLPPEAIDRIFTPDAPVLLPSHISGPFRTGKASDASAYIDVALVVADDGKAEDIEIVDASAGVTRDVQRDLVRLLKSGRFRPRLVDGQFADSLQMVVRYYPNG